MNKIRNLKSLFTMVFLFNKKVNVEDGLGRKPGWFNY